MKLSHLFALGLLGLVSVPLLASPPAQACTPHPDNPGGCNGPLGFPARSVKPVQGIKPIPGPVCLSCPPYQTQIKLDQIQPLTPIQPAHTQNNLKQLAIPLSAQ